jgi:hypothetical protein
MKFAVLILSFVMFSACSPGSKNATGEGPGKKQDTDSPELAQGLMNGVSWKFLSGVAWSNAVDPSQMRISLKNETFADPCSPFSIGKQALLSSVPAAVGDTALGVGNPMFTATFSFEESQGGYNNLVATEGHVKITAMSAEEVSGILNVKYDEANSVNGVFKLKVCPKSF